MSSSSTWSAGRPVSIALIRGLAWFICEWKYKHPCSVAFSAAGSTISGNFRARPHLQSLRNTEHRTVTTNMTVQYVLILSRTSSACYIILRGTDLSPGPDERHVLCIATKEKQKVSLQTRKCYSTSPTIIKCTLYFIVGMFIADSEAAASSAFHSDVTVFHCV